MSSGGAGARDAAGGTLAGVAPSQATVVLPASAGLGRAVTVASSPSIPLPPDTVASLPRTRAARNTLTEGVQVNQFEIIRELGRGGMGRVVLARDTKLARRVALKFLSKDIARTPEIAQKFVIEARATARCQHENIVVVYEVDEWDGSAYIALEYLEGQSMADLLKAGPIGATRTVEIMTAVARALVRAHAEGLVHCDLKPDNIFITRDGTVKVLDFGIARITASGDQRQLRAVKQELARGGSGFTVDEGTVSGTMPYMSFEQWGVDTIDHRSDIWACGIIFWEAIVGQHPLGVVEMQAILDAAVALDTPLPSIATAAPDLAPELVALVDRCLVKRRAGRLPDAKALLEALEALAPSRHARRRAADASPFPGMAAFQEQDADRFFGRDRDVAQALARLDQHPLLVLAGPSGVGKSSFVRAGLVPALRAQGSWDVIIARPGRDPMAALAGALAAAWPRHTGIAAPPDVATLQAELAAAPAALGNILRRLARERGVKILLFLDQVEELFTLAGAEVRGAFIQALLGVVDDVSSPLRVVASIRSDFLDRASENRELLDRFTRGILFLRPLDQAALREALTRPVASVGYAFEDDALVTDMVSALEHTSGALPLLQFAADTLWARRDTQRRLLTRAAYEAAGGIAGALATHAEAVVRALPSPRQRLLRTIALRLVTSDGTRAVVERTELEQLGEPGEVHALLDHLVGARLLAAGTDADQRGQVEIVHESLLAHWPSLRRWRDEAGEDTQYLEQLRAAAKQWDARQRPRGLLWSGDALDELRAFDRRYLEPLPPRERAFVDAALAEQGRAQRRRRNLVIGGFVAAGAITAAAVVGLVLVRGAEHTARE